MCINVENQCELQHYFYTHYKRHCSEFLESFLSSDTSVLIDTLAVGLYPNYIVWKCEKWIWFLSIDPEMYIFKNHQTT